MKKSNKIGKIGLVLVLSSLFFWILPPFLMPETARILFFTLAVVLMLTGFILSLIGVFKTPKKLAIISLVIFFVAIIVLLLATDLTY